MLDNDNIISTSVSEAVNKIPTDEKDYEEQMLLFSVSLYTATACKEQANIYYS